MFLGKDNLRICFVLGICFEILYKWINLKIDRFLRDFGWV